MVSDSWFPAALPDVPAVLTTDGQMVWAALAGGGVYASNDRGLSWTPIEPGLEGGDPLALLATPQGLVVSTETGVWQARPSEGWTLSGAGLPADELVTLLAHADGHVVAGTLTAGLFRSSGDLRYWHPVEMSLPARHNRLTIFALAGGPMGLYAAHPLGLSHSTDAGVTWESASFGLPPSVLLNALSVGRAVWASGGGAIFRSDDGASWQSVYARGAKRPLVLIAGAGDLLVARETDSASLYRSCDGGVTWESFGQGLPGDLFATSGVFVAETLLLTTLPGGVWRYQASHLRPRPAPIELLHQPPTTRGEVAFTLRASTHVVLSVHDMSGTEVARLLDGEPARGRHQYQLDNVLPPGLYEWRLVGGEIRQARSFILLP